MSLPLRKPELWRVALLVLVLAGITWLGGSHVRAVIGNHLLRPGTLEFAEELSPEAQREVFRLLSFTSFSVLGSYLLVLVSGTIFLATTPLRMRENGWLMMSAILFYLFVPLELYLIYLDGRMMYYEFFTTAGNETFRELFHARLSALAGLPYIATLCYYTVVALAVLQPFRRPPGAAS